MRTVKQSTAYNLLVFMTDSSDHVTGKASLTLTITASKDGAAFASITPTVTERGNGWYSLALTTSHTDTLGDLALHITGTAADPSDLAVQVRSKILGDTQPADILSISGDTTAADNAETAFDGGSFNVGGGGVVVASLGSTAKADVNAEVLDVLNTDTFAEPGQEAPAATNTLAKKIGYLFKLARNRVTQDSTTLKVYADDATTVDQKATVSDSGTVYDRGEIGTGP